MDEVWCLRIRCRKLSDRHVAPKITFVEVNSCGVDLRFDRTNVLNSHPNTSKCELSDEIHRYMGNQNFARLFDTGNLIQTGDHQPQKYQEI